MKNLMALLACALATVSLQVAAQEAVQKEVQNAEKNRPAVHDAGLARALGGNANGMRGYVLVLLKTGPTRVPDGAARDTMFAGHFANMERLAGQKKLAVAGPLDGVDGLRGLFILATTDLDEAKALVATDPVIVNGEMVAEYHTFFSSAALMAVSDIHGRISKK
jgi:uncharacterized protein YciI